jgi:hypothetical protein
MRAVFAALVAALLLGIPVVTRADEVGMQCDVTLYGLLAGMGGDVGVNGHTATVDMSASDLLSHLESGFMGRVGLRRGPWRVGVDVIYMGLEASPDTPAVHATVDQWMVEPSLGYRTSDRLEVLGGVRYNNVMDEVKFQGPLGAQGSRTEEWWDPFVGARWTLPIKEKSRVDLRGDVGGFGIGSDLALQGEATLHLGLASWAEGVLGYRALYMDYENGDDGFLYKVTSYGPMVGLTFLF